MILNEDERKNKTSYPYLRNIIIMDKFSIKKREEFLSFLKSAYH